MPESGQSLVFELTDPLMNAYLDHVRFEKRLAKRTCELYFEDLKKLSELLLERGIGPKEASSADFRYWLARMHNSGRTPRGIALILSGWRGFYNWLGRQGHLKVNPILGIKSPKVPKPLPKALSVDDAVMLADYRASKETDAPWYELRDRAMVELLYGSGLRVSELAGLDVDATHSKIRGWIDLEGGEAHVLGKGSKWRTVPVGVQAIHALRAWIAQRSEKQCKDDSQDYIQKLGSNVSNESNVSKAVKHSSDASALFIGHNGTRLTPQSIWQRLRRRSLHAGLSTPVHPHMLRHSFASHLLQSSSDLRAVQEMLGHANISTTQVYTRLDFQHLAKAYDNAHPRATRVKKTSKK